MKKLYEGQKHSLYEIQKEIGCGKDTLYKHANGERKVENMRPEILVAIAYFEKIPVNKLYKEMKDYQKKRKLI